MAKLNNILISLQKIADGDVFIQHARTKKQQAAGEKAIVRQLEEKAKAYNFPKPRHDFTQADADKVKAIYQEGADDAARGGKEGWKKGGEEGQKTRMRRAVHRVMGGKELRATEADKLTIPASGKASALTPEYRTRKRAEYQRSFDRRQGKEKPSYPLRDFEKPFSQGGGSSD